MATMRIDPIDSATICPSYSRAPFPVPNGQTISRGQIQRWDQFDYFRFYTSTDDGNKYMAYAMIMLFPVIDVSFLYTAKISSMKLMLRVNQYHYGNMDHSNLYLTKRMTQGQTTYPTDQSAGDLIYDRVYFATTPQTTSGLWLSIDIPSVDTLRNIVQNSYLMSSANSVGESGAVSFYGVRAAAASRPYIVIEYEDSSTPPTCEATYPVNNLLNGSIVNRFTWSYAQVVNQPQSHYDLQMYVNGAWVTVANKVASANKYRDIPAGYFATSGEYQWRVRVYSKSGTTVSAWSTASFVVQTAPVVPIITQVNAIPQATIVWQAAEQMGYQVRIYRESSPSDTSLEVVLTLVYDGVPTIGTARTFTYPGLLNDGEAYRFQVRVVNSSAMWSDWAYSTARIVNNPEQDIWLTTECDVNNTCIMLLWRHRDGYPDMDPVYIIYRDGNPIAEVVNAWAYTDRLSNGTCTYTVRSVHSGNYSESNNSTETLNITNGLIAVVDVYDWLRLEKRLNDIPRHSASFSPNYAYKQYDGKTRPVKYTDDFRMNVHTLSFTFKDQESHDTLYGMLNRTVVYKDCMGSIIIGNLEKLETDMSRVYDFSFAITETDFKEGNYQW